MENSKTVKLPNQQLSIPYAQLHDGSMFPAISLSQMQPIDASKMRVEAVRSKSKGINLYQCPYCQRALYPHAGGTIHWSHFPGEGAHLDCCYATKKPITLNQLESLVYKGRQKGSVHESLCAKIGEMLLADPNVDRDSIKIDKYDKPISSENHGRYPDVRCETDYGTIVFEVQTSPILLYRLVARIQYYKSQNAKLVWVTTSTDMYKVLPIYLWDILAAQDAIAFDIPDNVYHDAKKTSIFMLRERSGFGNSTGIKERVVNLRQLFIEWSEFADRWIVERKMRRLDSNLLVSEARAACLIPDHELADYEIKKVIDWLLTIAADVPIGYTTNVSQVVNSALTSDLGKRCAGLLLRAIERYNPELLSERKWIVLKIKECTKGYDDLTRPRQFARGSKVDNIRAFLFPNWELPLPTQRSQHLSNTITPL